MGRCIWSIKQCKKNANVTCWSANSFVKSIAENSENINKSPQTKCIFLILWYHYKETLKTLVYSQNWKHIAFILNSNSTFIVKNLPCCRSTFESGWRICGATMESLSLGWTGRLFLAIFLKTKRQYQRHCQTMKQC